jgi:predicted nucleic acid-binding protein
MIQVYFDANIWIDYCWNKYYAKKRITRHKKPNTIAIHKINSKKAKIVLSTPLLYEIISHFKDYFILQAVMGDGFSAFEFSKVRKNYTLSRVDRKKADGIYTDITTRPITKDQILVNWLNEETLEKVLRLTAKYEIDFMDCLHFMAALKGGCSVFVTKDETFINGIKHASKRYRSLKRITVMKPSEFISRYKATIFKK